MHYNYVVNTKEGTICFYLTGMSEDANICIVCHCYRESETIIRIISARKATKKEEERYVKGI